MKPTNNRKWPFKTKPGFKIIVEAPTYKKAKQVLIDIKNETK
jgi:hypothetical protein